MFDNGSDPQRRCRSKQPTYDFVSLAAAELRKLRAKPAPTAATTETWTPKLAGEVLIEALRWIRFAGRRVGPQGMVAMKLPDTILTMEDRLALAWSLEESADEERERRPIGCVTEVWLDREVSG
jgi:hypothetical protein